MYVDKLTPIVEEYISGLNVGCCIPYENDERNLSLQKTNLFIEKVHKQISEENEYVLNLIAWLNCVPYLQEIYKQNSLDEDVFYESMKDFSYKVKECKTVYGICGLFANWFFLFFELKEFMLGRLQYEVSRFEFDEYVSGNTKIRKGDIVYSCHIPSSGPLTYELCMDSFQKAYEFFKADIKDDIIPIISHTWLLYKPYIDKIFPKDSNLKKFANMFDIINVTSAGKDFPDGWRVFGKMYRGTTDNLPADNTLRRNFIEYINSGGDFGYGYGIILYNGKTRSIMNTGGN
ncbi:MAG: DUF5596 domain-containing protein [Clostridia bacterium]|nr:DUF5596 domain-containing protein [Clostridia bacterium]